MTDYCFNDNRGKELEFANLLNRLSNDIISGHVRLIEADHQRVFETHDGISSLTGRETLSIYFYRQSTGGQLMTNKITLEEALELITFEQDVDSAWYVKEVHGDVEGDVNGTVQGDIKEHVWGTINGRKWAYVERPIEKLERLIRETGNLEMIDAFKQLEDNS